MADKARTKPDFTCPKCKLRFAVQFYSRADKAVRYMQPMHCPNCGHRFRWAR